MKLLISVSSHRPWSGYFGMSMFRLIPHLAKTKVETEIRPLVGCSLLSAGRQRGLDAAIEEGFSHILYIDDDMVFDPKAVDSLISRDKDFVAANYVTKGEGSRPVTTGLDFKTLHSAGKTGVERIYQTGLGFALIKTSIFKDIPAPHFEVPWVPEKKDYMGEDSYACRLLGHHGIELWIDHDAARNVAHCGEFIYREDFSGDEQPKPEGSSGEA